MTPRLLIATLGLVIGLWLVPPAARAATCTVPATYATIQAAIAVPSCTLITVAAGTYDGPITIARDLTLRGVGDVSIIRAPAAPLADPKAIIRVTGAATNAVIERFKITGPGSGACNSLLAGVYVDGDAFATIRNNRFVAIRDNPLGGCVDGGVAILVGRWPTTNGQATISKNIIEDYQRGGIVVENTGSSATIIDNTLYGSGERPVGLAAQNGIQASDTADIKVLKNRVFDHRYDPAGGVSSAGILLYTPGNLLSVTGNTVERNDVGIWLIDTTNATVTTNKVHDSTYDGISLDGFNGPGPVTLNTVSRNQLRRNGTGLGLYDADSNTVDSNTAMETNGPGFFIDIDSSGNTFTKNRSNKNAGAGIEDTSTGGGTAGTANTYSGNICSANIGGDSLPAGICL